METIPLDEPHRQRGPDASPPGISGFGADDPDVAGPIRAFNAANKTHEELWARVHQAGDAVRRGRDEEQLARQAAGEEHDAHLAIQAERPNRRAPLFRQMAIAAATVGLDAVACWFAAQALGNGQLETDLWAGLFLAILAEQVALDQYSDRSRRAWRLLAGGLAAFVAGLGVLRYLFLDTVGTDGGVAALVGAALFTAATGRTIMIGYRALRAGETFAAAQAQLRARRAEREAADHGQAGPLQRGKRPPGRRLPEQDPGVPAQGLHLQ